MSIDDIRYEKVFVVDENDVVSLEIRVGSTTNATMLLVYAAMVD
jgi:hypothetical protein